MKSIKSILMTALFLSGISAHAEWVESGLEYEMKSREPKEIAGALVVFKQLHRYLSADALTAPSRMVVKAIDGRVMRYTWKNDNECSVDNPEAVKPVSMTVASAEFIYENNPDESWELDTIVSQPTPCQKQEGEKVIHRRRLASK